MNAKIRVRKMAKWSKWALGLCLTAALVMAAGCTSATASSGGGGSGVSVNYGAGNSGATTSQVPPKDSGAYAVGDIATVQDRGSLPADASPDGSAAGKYFIGWSMKDPAAGDSFDVLAKSVDYIPGEQFVIAKATSLHAVYVTVASPVTAGERVYTLTAAANKPAAAPDTDVKGSFSNYYPDKQKVAVGQTVRPHLTAGYSIDGYVLKGWGLNSTTVVTTPLVVPNSVTDTAFVATAIWAQLSIATITYNVNGSTSAAPLAPASFTWPTAITLPDGAGITAPSGKSFKGWAYTLADATAGTVVADADAIAAGTQWKPATQPATAVANDAGALGITFYAVWVTTPVIAITYNINDGTGTAPTAPATLTWPDAITLPDATGMTAPAGKEFKGWALTATGVIVTDMDTVTPNVQWKPAAMPTTANSTQIFYAVWETPLVAVIKITFNANSGGGTAPALATITWPAFATLPGVGEMTPPTNKVFAGWAQSLADAAAGTNILAAGAQWRPAEKPVIELTEATLYAVWVFPIVNISYNSNGNGIAPVTPASLTWPAYATLPGIGSMTAPANRIFGGWSLSLTGAAIVDMDAAATGTQWRPATTPVTTPTTQILYAVWAYPAITIVFDFNGGTGTALTDVTYTGPDPITLPDRGGIVAPANQAFKGWADSPSNATAGTTVTDLNTGVLGVQWKPTTTSSPVRLYAVWVSPVVNISYDNNGGTGNATTTPASLTWPAYATLSGIGSMTAPANKIFGGWSLTLTGAAIVDMDAVATGTQWRPDFAPTLPSVTETLYAVWVSPVVNISYNHHGSAGGFEPSEPSRLTWPNAVTLPGIGGLRAPADTLFKGWALTAELANAGTVVPDSDLVADDIQWKPDTMPTTTPTAQILYATWVNPIINITYSANGGTGTAPTTPESLVWPGYIALPTPASGSMTGPTGKVFKGWATSAAGAPITDMDGNTGNGTSWRPSTMPAALSSTHTLYAVWGLSVPPVITVTYDKNTGGGTAPGSASITWGTPIDLPNGSTMTSPDANKLFKGWALTAALANAGTVVTDVDTAKAGVQWQPATEPDTATSSQTLYAAWAYPIVHITYNLMNRPGTAPATPNLLTWPTAVTLPDASQTPPGLEGETFRTWTLQEMNDPVVDADANMPGLQWKPATMPTSYESSKTLYALWYSHTMYLRYDANGGDNEPGGTYFSWPTYFTLNYSSSMTPPSSALAFAGWAVSQSDATNGVLIVDAQADVAGVQWRPATEPTEDLTRYTLYAVWKNSTISVSYNANGGSNPPTAPASFVLPAYLTLPAAGTMAGPTGKNFVGWALSQADANSQVSIADMDTAAAGIQWKPLIVPAAGSLTLYAIWN